MSAFLRKYATGTGADVYVPMIKRAVVDFAVGADWTPAAGDVKISIDGGAAANIGTLPVAVAMGNTAYWKFVLSDAELTGKQMIVTVADSATKVVEDQAFDIQTFGHASAFFVTDWTDAVRQGMTALPNAAAQASGGLYTRGTGAGQINQAANGQVDTNTAAMAAGVVTATVIADGAIDAGAIASDAITAAKIATGAITNAKFAAGAIDAAAIATDAIDSDAIAASAVTEITSGLATTANVSAVETDTQDIQARLPAALVTGRMDASVGAYASGQAPLQPTVAGRTLDVTVGGEAGVDWANVGSPTTTLNLSGTSTKAVEPTVAGRTLNVSAAGEADADLKLVEGATAGAISSAVPSATPAWNTLFNWLFTLSRNRVNLTKTTGNQVVYAADGTTVVGTAVTSDDGSVFERGPWT